MTLRSIVILVNTPMLVAVYQAIGRRQYRLAGVSPIDSLTSSSCKRLTS